MLDIEWVEAATPLITVFLDSEDAALQFGKGFQWLFIVSRFGFCNGSGEPSVSTQVLQIVCNKLVAAC